MPLIDTDQHPNASRAPDTPTAASNRRQLLRLYDQPVFLFLAIMASIFTVETLVMVILRRLPALPLLSEAILDAVLLSLLAAPLLYFLFLKPLELSIRTREATEVERQKALQFDRMKSEFISTAAHELFTPLATIKGYVELLMSEEYQARLPEEERKAFLSIILDKSDALERIIDDMLELSRSENGQLLSMSVERDDIVPLVADITDSYRHRFPSHRFELALPGGLPPLPFDRIRISQVLGNLLSNAVKYSAVGSAVSVSGQVREKELLFQVQDEGIGMSDEQVQRVFDKFYRADTSDTAKGGLGLGMTIARAIVEGHGGAIWVASTPGRGTTVSFTLPLAETVTAIVPASDDR